MPSMANALTDWKRWGMAAAVLATAVWVAMAGCKSGSSDSINPYEAAGPQKPENESNLLKIDTDDSGPKPVNPFPSPPKTYSISVDGSFDEWDESAFRQFDGSSYVVSGDRFWDGQRDASLRVGVRADSGYLYLAVEAIDDKVVTAPGGTIGDGVVVWLRSPDIASVTEMLPDKPGFELMPDVAYLIEPDGSVKPYAPESFVDHHDASALTARTSRTDRGWQTEIAMEAGAVPQLSHLPIGEIAFRVELFDGDDPKHPSYQSKLNILPSPESEPRFAIYSGFPSQGWLPYRPVFDEPPRPDTLGRWRLTNKGWQYERFDAEPANWNRVSDTGAINRAVSAAPEFMGVCPPSRRDLVLPAGFESKNGQHRAALVLCGRDARETGSCPANSELRVFWVQLQRAPRVAESAKPAEKWKLDQMSELTDEPFEQCIGATANPPLRRRFTLIPLDRIHSDVWALGFQVHASSGSRLQQARNVWIFRPSRKESREPKATSEPHIEKASLDKLDAKPGSRTISNSLLYLTPVDRKDGWDLCRVETIKNQDCRQFNEQCATRQRGQEVLVHIDLWDPDRRLFTDFMMTKHRRCGPDFDFSKREAFMLIQHEERLSLIRSPMLDNR